MDVELSVNMSSPGMGWEVISWMGESDDSLVYAHFFCRESPEHNVGNPLQGVFSFDDGKRWPSPLHRLRSHSKYLKAARILYKSRSVDENMSYGPWHCNSDFCQEACACVFGSLSVRNKHATLFWCMVLMRTCIRRGGWGSFQARVCEDGKLNAQLDMQKVYVPNSDQSLVTTLIF